MSLLVGSVEGETGTGEVLHHLVDLTLYQIFLDRRCVRVLHWEAPGAVHVEDKTALDAAHTRMNSPVNCVIVDRGDDVIAAPCLSRSPVVADEDAVRCSRG